MKKFIFTATIALSTVLAFADKPFDTTVGEFFKNPVGYSLESPTFSWKLPVGEKNAVQTAYQITVMKTPDGRGEIPVWDSGKVLSSQSVKVPYGGKPLSSRERLYWRVRYWDADGNSSDWSDANFFEAGLLNNSDWLAKWIFSPDPRISKTVKINRPSHKNEHVADYLPPTYLRKEADFGKKIKSARLYVASRGIFQFYINGKKVGNDFWGTGWTDYKTRIQTNTYDITKMLWRGKNTFGAIIADGWYSGRMSSDKKSRGFYGDRPEILAQIEVEYADGSRETVATDASWKYSFGAILYSDIYDGEAYDARREMPDWNKNGFDDSAWKTPAEKNVEAKPLLEPRRNQPIVIKDILTPVSVRKVAKGTYIFDLGQNIAGWARIKIPARYGKTVRLRFAEMLKQDGTLYTDNYRSALSEDFYTSAGGIRPDEWEPLFTYHGFRYVELSGLSDEIEPQTDWVSGVVLYNDMPDTGSFFCSKPKINALQNCIRWGQRANFFSTPTDCPQRDERLGWTGDAQVFVPTAAFNMDVSAFFTKWTLDLADSAKKFGAPAAIAPAVFGAQGNAAWADAIAICPWEIYAAFGDKKILENNYEAIAGWVEYMRKTSKDLIRPDAGFGDWLQPNGKPNPAHSDAPRDLIGTAYFVRSTDIAAKVAKILGKDADAKRFEKLADDVRAAFVKAYVSPDGTVKSDSQTAYLLTLAFDIAPETSREKIFGKLVSAIARDGYRLNTGFVGTPLLNPVLTRFGRMDLAYRLANNEGYPSWIFPINQGATTMWERWNSYSHEKGFGSAGMNSFNHYAYGAIGQWLYKDVAGIWRDENAPGYKNILFQPKPGGGFTFANATHETPYGTASSSWKITDGVMEWTVVIPPNATGKITFPTRNANSIRVNGRPLATSALTFDDGFPTIENAPSGTYEILLRPHCAGEPRKAAK